VQEEPTARVEGARGQLSDSEKAPVLLAIFVMLSGSVPVFVYVKGDAAELVPTC
jgi:hypothetical protein